MSRKVQSKKSLPLEHKVDFLTFLAFEAVQEGYKLVPEMHKEIARWLETTAGNPKRLLLAYRHSGKSWITDVYIAWRLYMDPNFTAIVISATTENSRDKARFIRSIIENHPLTAHLVNNDEHWQQTTFTVKRPKVSRFPSVRCTSILSSITGKHADLVVADDVEVSDNVETTEARDKIKDNVMELTSIADNLLFCGTPHHEESIYEYLKTVNFLTLKLPVYDDNHNPRMPEIHSLEWIKSKEDTNTTGRFQSQYLLIPTRAAETWMSWDMIQVVNDDMVVSTFETYKLGFHSARPVFYVGDHQIIDIRAYWDPASGLQGKDASVIAAVCRTKTNDVVVIDGEILPEVDLKNGTGFNAQCEKVLGFCKRNHVSVIYVEKNFSITLATELKNYARLTNSKVIIRETTRTGNTRKNEFIARNIEPLAKTQKFFIHERCLKKTNFKEEFQDFPHSKHDDCLDCVAGAIDQLIHVNPISGKELIGGVGPKRSPKPVEINTYRSNPQNEYRLQ